MNITTQNTFWRRCCLAIIFIPLIAVSRGLQAQNVYKCGSSYSQTPCAGASTLYLDDARTSAQKQQTDAAMRSDTKRAKLLEKERLAQEKANVSRSLSKTSTAAPATTSMAPPVKPRDTHNVVGWITPKRLKSPGYKPEAFIALVPGSNKKPVQKKVTKKKLVRSD